ncbi:MAG: maleylpyruvate isomerase family mycothiol-dependent enzyme [Acidimicrobiales bacterium]
MAGVVDVEWIIPLWSTEAARRAEMEDARFLDVVRRLDAGDWGRPTDCEGWDVRALVSHVVGAYESLASWRELAHQIKGGRALGEQLGLKNVLDATNELQVRDRTACSPAELVGRLERAAPGARRRRRRLAGRLRRVRVPVADTAPISLGQVLAVVYTRGTWMHRVDISRAVDREIELTPGHDGRIVADVVREWAGHHGRPFRLDLTGPAGGSYEQGAGGEEHRLDAVEFCRALSGRWNGTGLLEARVAF